MYERKKADKKAEAMGFIEELVGEVEVDFTREENEVSHFPKSQLLLFGTLFAGRGYGRSRPENPFAHFHPGIELIRLTSRARREAVPSFSLPSR